MNKDPLTAITIYEDRAGIDTLANADDVSRTEMARSIASKSEVDYVTNELKEIDITVCSLEIRDLENPDTVQHIQKIKGRKIIWNVTDGDTPLKGGSVPAFAKLIGVPFLGSTSYVRALCNAKHHWKELVRDQGVPVTSHVVLYNMDDLKNLSITDCSFPVFVKPSKFGNSAGINLINPICNSVEAALYSCEILLANKLGPIIVEPFLSGDEYSVAAIHKDAWTTAAFIKQFPDDYLTPEVKDGKQNHLFNVTEIDGKYIKQLASTAIDILGIKDYARFDFRKSIDGKMHMMDINAGCFLLGSTMRNFIASQEGGFGVGFKKLIDFSISRQSQ